MPRRRNAKILFATFLTLIGAAAALYGAVGNPFDPFDDRRFSVQAWSEAPEESRARMARDAVRRHLPPGLTEPGVVSLLGPPESVLTREAGERRSEARGRTRTTWGTGVGTGWTPPTFMYTSTVPVR